MNVLCNTYKDNEQFSFWYFMAFYTPPLCSWSVEKQQNQWYPANSHPEDNRLHQQAHIYKVNNMAVKMAIKSGLQVIYT